MNTVTVPSHLGKYSTDGKQILSISGTISIAYKNLDDYLEQYVKLNKDF